MDKINRKDLKMGIVKANFIIINKNNKSIWINRDFKECTNKRFIPSRRGISEEETIMLGIPKTIVEFGINNFVNAKILEASTCHGDYGEGGPGFFGLLCDTKQGIFTLTLTIWAGGNYIMMDERVIECHPNYNSLYNPWHVWDDTGMIMEINSILESAEIKNIELSDLDCKINLRFTDNTEHEMIIYNNNENLPPMGNGQQRRKAFETGTLADYLLVTYSGTHLLV